MPSERVDTNVLRHRSDGDDLDSPTGDLLTRAADELDAARERERVLREALEPFTDGSVNGHENYCRSLNTIGPHGCDCDRDAIRAKATAALAATGETR